MIRSQLGRVLLSGAVTMALALVAGLGSSPASLAAGGSALRLYGTGSSDLDRVKIPLGPVSNGQLTASRPVNVGGDFTLEFWLKATAANNTAPACAEWYYGNIVVDRDVYGGGDYGDYGVAICDGRVVFGVAVGNDDPIATGGTAVTDGQWHHIAVTRSTSSGQLRIYLDGALDGSASGPTGRIDYRTNRPTSYANDPYLVLGAEKHDYPGSRYYNGLLDDLRISNTVRYSGNFTRPGAPHSADASTMALYHFDEGSGTTVGESSAAGGGPSGGELRPRSGGAGQHWSSDTPFGQVPGPDPSPSTSPSPDPSASPSTSPSPDPSASPSATPPVPRGCASPAAGSVASAVTPMASTPLNLAQSRRVFLPFVGCAVR